MGKLAKRLKFVQNDVFCFIFEGILFCWCKEAKELRKESLSKLINSI